MPLVSTSTKTLQIKIVYYGPGLSGKTTNLEKLNVLLSKNRVGDLMSLDTSGDRTLYFDWMPVELGKIKGFDVKIQLYTVPGQVRYNNTRRQVLSGVDGIVFVADSQKGAAEQNVYSYNNLKENLELLGMDIEKIPMVIQCNKKDLPETMTTREMAKLLKVEHRPFIEAVASAGKGVLETLRLSTRITMKQVQKYLDPRSVSMAAGADESDYDGDILLSKIMENESKDSKREPGKSEKTEDDKTPVPESAEEIVEPEIEIEAEPSDGDPIADESTSVEFQMKIAPKLKENPLESKSGSLESGPFEEPEFEVGEEKAETSSGDVKESGVEKVDEVEKVKEIEDDKTPVPESVSFSPPETQSSEVEPVQIREIEELRKEITSLKAQVIDLEKHKKKLEKMEAMVNAQQKELMRLRGIFVAISEIIIKK